VSGQPRKEEIHLNRAQWKQRNTQTAPKPTPFSACTRLQTFKLNNTTAATAPQPHNPQQLARPRLHHPQPLPANANNNTPPQSLPTNKLG